MAGHGCDGVARLADYVNTHANLTVDVGQVLFGETTSMTADGPVGQYLHSLTGRKWLSHDVELETGCGVVPIKYEDKNFVHALQWAIGIASTTSGTRIRCTTRKSSVGARF